MPPKASQKLGVKGHGKGDTTKLRLEMVFLHRHPLALGPLPGKPLGENQSQQLHTPQEQAGTTLRGHR